MKKLFYTVIFYSLMVPLLIATIIPVWVIYKLLSPFLSSAAKATLAEYVFRIWATLTIKLTGADFQVIGQKNIRTDKASIFFINHQSMLDIPFAIKAIKVQFSFIAKAKYKKMPAVATWFKAAGGIFFSQGKGRAEFERIKEVVKRVKNGDNFAIFPEGTRSVTGELGEFKTVPFKIAKMSQATIYIVTLAGTFTVMSKKDKTITPTKVFAIINPPLYWDDYKDLDARELTEYTWGKMQENKTLIRPYLNERRWASSLSDKFFEFEKSLPRLDLNNDSSSLIAGGSK